jgi:hypothetical protein
MRCAGIIALAALLYLSAPAKAELVVSISKSQQRLAVIVDGTEAYRWPVSTGRRGHQTPAGTFHPIRLERHWYSREYSLTPMPWAMFFYRGYAVHGTMEAYNLGHAASHGCVRLRPDNASILYTLLRHNGLRNATFVVMDGPLPAAPGAAPLADSGSPLVPADVAEHFAKALSGDDEADAPATSSDLSARRDDAAGDATQHPTNRLARAGNYHVTVSSDEAQVLRERQAWLRGLARKYGFNKW